MNGIFFPSFGMISTWHHDRAHDWLRWLGRFVVPFKSPLHSIIKILTIIWNNPAWAIILRYLSTHKSLFHPSIHSSHPDLSSLCTIHVILLFLILFKSSSCHGLTQVFVYNYEAGKLLASGWLHKVNHLSQEESQFSCLYRRMQKNMTVTQLMFLKWLVCKKS